jgi:hypothetical protein
MGAPKPHSYPRALPFLSQALLSLTCPRSSLALIYTRRAPPFLSRAPVALTLTCKALSQASLAPVELSIPIELPPQATGSFGVSHVTQFFFQGALGASASYENHSASFKKL